MQLGDGYAAAGDDHRAQLCYANALRAARHQPVIALPVSHTAGPDTVVDVRDDRDPSSVPADDRALPPRV